MCGAQDYSPHYLEFRIWFSEVFFEIYKIFMQIFFRCGIIRKKGICKYGWQVGA